MKSPKLVLISLFLAHYRLFCTNPPNLYLPRCFIAGGNKFITTLANRGLVGVNLAAKTNENTFTLLIRVINLVTSSKINVSGECLFVNPLELTSRDQMGFKLHQIVFRATRDGMSWQLLLFERRNFIGGFNFHLLKQIRIAWHPKSLSFLSPTD